MCWNLWTFSRCSHKQAELAHCGRGNLLCRTINRDDLINDDVCFNCTVYEASDMTPTRYNKEIEKAEALYYYVKGPGGNVNMGSADLWRL
ncbi:hypothetical protein Dda_9268 [Drechslerella dactyloides]|uniref:Uncharacterized protein n=1 Tax=Drechslerella dactyloides TaxID=74499 RepID=A0AAD6IR24_DREDA|nr:hypothetical protein Dda_9268 [Drechslerella dactyloides]